MKPPTCSRCSTVYSLDARESGSKQRGQREHLKHPLLLRCGHTFCRSCLRRRESTKDIIQCPECQKQTKLGSEALSPDIYTAGLLWTRHLELELQSDKISSDGGIKAKKKPKAAGDAAKAIPCGECNNAATCQCLKCDSVLCRSCFDKVHQMAVSLRKHQPAPLKDSGPLEERMMVQKKRRSQFCSTHEESQIEYFCNNDNKPICSRCVIMGDHKSHDIQTLEDKNRECLSEMESAMVTVQETIWRLEKSEQVINKAMPLAKVDTSGLVEEVQLHFRKVHSLLQAREEQLLDEIRAAAVSITNPFQETKSFLQNNKLMLEMALTDAARAKQGSLHTLVDADLILEQLKKAEDIACIVTVEKEAVSEPLRFSFDSAVKDTIGSYGSISTRSATQMIILSLPGPDAKKPPVEELHSVTLPDLDLASSDNESVTDSASVIVEEEKEEAGSIENEVTTAEAKTGLASDSPGKRLVVGYSDKVQVTHIRTPAQFYVQLTSSRGELETMQRHINHYCSMLSHRGKGTAPECLEPGTLVLAKFSGDKNWYRAVITKTTEVEKGDKKAQTSYQVFFMDYGNSETVPLRELRPIIQKFESHPAFAYECSLFDLMPVDKTKGWTEESVKVMLQMTSNDFTIMKVMEEGLGALPVDLLRPEMDRQCMDDQPVSLRDALLFLELAVFNTFPPNTTPAGHVKRDFISPAAARDGTVLATAVNHVDTPSCFFVQTGEKLISQYMERLVMKMQDNYYGHNLHRYTIFCPREGMICVAKYYKDCQWYRARVTGLPGACKVQVKFVDFGNTEIVDHTDVRKILQDHVKFPQQAIECSLVDVEPTDNGQWSEEALAWFKEVTELQYSQIRVIGRSNKGNSMAGVLYVISQENQLCCINFELVQRGFARSTGPWSQEASFQGITLKPDPKAESSSSPFTPTKQHAPSPTHPQRSSGPRQQRTPPRKACPSPVSGEKCFSPSPKSKAPGKITLKNLHISADQPAEEGAQPESIGLEVVITGYKSPGQFFIQLQEKQQELLGLMSDLASYETEAPADYMWKVGECCVAKCTKDNSWYRANIARVLEDNSYEVNLMDFGFVDVVPANRLRTLKQVHGQKPCFAERCHLAGLTPAGSADRTQWSATAIDFMADEIRAKRLFLKLEGDKIPDLGLPVDILIENLIPESALEPLRHEYMSLVARLQDRGLAFPVKTTHKSDSVSTLTSDLQTPKTDPFHTNVVTSFPESSFTDNTTMEEVNGKTEDPDHNPTNTSVVEEAAVIEQPDYDVAPHPPPTPSTITVLTVHVDSMGVIYTHDYEDEEACTAFMDKIDTYAKTQAPKGHLKVKVGQVCLAWYDIDDAWYRARVLEIDENSAKVKYIDYGNTRQVDRKLLRLITPEQCEVPQWALEFKLHNLKPETVDGSWPSSYIDYMDQQLVNKKCTALIKGDRQQHPLGVDLLYNEGESISATLLESGVASKENNMEDFYERTADISNILQHSNPYFPLRPGDTGDVLTGLVTHVELPNLVYIQRCATSPDDHSSLPEDMVKFAQMMEDLNDSSQDAPLKEVPAAGEMCCARFSQDERWYRALVAKTFPHNQTVLVLYVDYGNSEVVTLDRLQVLPTMFQDTPAQALRAYLNVDLPQGTTRWPYSTYKAMAEAVFLRRHIVLIKFTDPLTVELFSEDEQLNGAAVLSYQSLIRDGLITLPKPVSDTEDTDNVIVESDSEVAEEL